MNRIGFHVAIAALLVAAAGRATAAPVSSFQPLPVLLFLDEDYLGRDYFLKDRDRAIFDQVRNVERFHMSDENFWKAYNEGRLGVARDELEFVLRYIPNHPRGLYLMGMVSRKMNDDGYALRFYERAIRLFPQHAYTRVYYGRYLTEIGSLDLGIQYLKEGLAADPSLTVAVAWLAEAEHRRDQAAR